MSDSVGDMGGASGTGTTPPSGTNPLNPSHDDIYNMLSLFLKSDDPGGLNSQVRGRVLTQLIARHVTRQQERAFGSTNCTTVPVKRESHRALSHSPL